MQLKSKTMICTVCKKNLIKAWFIKMTYEKNKNVE